MFGSLRRGPAGLVVMGVAALAAACAHDAREPRGVRTAAHDHAAGRGEAAFTSLHDGWTPAGVTVEAGQYFTVFGDGAVALGAEAPPQPPAQYLWARIGGAGPIVNLATDEDTLRAPHAGEIELAVKPIGVYWDEHDPAGSLPGGFASLPAAPIDVSANVTVWRDDPAAGLAALTRAPDDRFARAHAALDSRPELPDGFGYLWYLGRSYIFSAWEEGARTGVHGLPNMSGAIISKPVDIPVTEDTELSFEWIYDHVPALGPETEARFHDYLSIALKFDNGQDLTWMRSEHLEAEQSFRCPLPWWDTRETHIVIEDAEDPLGEWRSHARNVMDDYAGAVGGAPPSRITEVWFINVGYFGGHDGDARFANVAITSNGERTEVFGAR